MQSGCESRSPHSQKPQKGQMGMAGVAMPAHGWETADLQNMLVRLGCTASWARRGL